MNSIASGAFTRGYQRRGCVLPSTTRNAPSRHLSIVSRVSSNRYQWSESEFLRVSLVEEPYGPIKIYQNANNNMKFTGIMSLRKSSDLEKTTATTEIVEMFVAGDTAANLYMVLNSEKSDPRDNLERQMGSPVVHDVISNILLKVQAEDPRHWGLLKVAIVSLENDVFVGRMFFGDKETGKVYFDTDVRPSDGIFLALSSKAPIFCKGNIWSDTCKPLSDSTVHQMMSLNEELPQGAIMPMPEQSEPQLDKSRRSVSPADFTKLLEEDLDAIKLLKRKLLVAVKEEDYMTAASIRDHPYLIVYRDICQSKILGDSQRASDLEAELQRQIEKNALLAEPKHSGFSGKIYESFHRP